MPIRIKKQPKRKIYYIETAFIFLAIWAALYLSGIPQLVEKRAAGPTCPINGAVCSWDSLGQGVKYLVEVYDITIQAVVAKGTTSKNSVNFNASFNHKYKCTVIAENSCGRGPEASADSECSNLIPRASPMPSIGSLPETGKTDTEVTPEISISLAEENRTDPASEEAGVRTKGSQLKTGTVILVLINFIFLLGVTGYFIFKRLRKKNEN